MSNILYRRWIFFSPAPSSLNSHRFPSFQNPRCEVHEDVSMVGFTNLFEKIKNVFYLRTKRTIQIESKLLLISFKLLNTSKTIHRLITLTNKSKTETVAKLCEIKSYEVWKKFRIISPRFKIFSSKLVQNSKTSPSTALPLRQTQQSWKFQYCTVRRCCLGQSRGEQVAATCVVTPLKKGRGEREREREREFCQLPAIYQDPSARAWFEDLGSVDPDSSILSRL